MPLITIFNPNDQPTGKLRLLDELRTSLLSADYDELLITVAFAKSGPLFRLKPQIDRWLNRQKSIKAIFGINHRGTSKQALQFALEEFSELYVLYAGEYFTFHPKMYLFFGPAQCRFYVGSHNLTVGGTETNWECGLRLDLTSADDEGLIKYMREVWEELLRSSKQLTTIELEQLDSEGYLLDEAAPRRPSGRAGRLLAKTTISVIDSFPQLVAKPASSLPQSVVLDPGTTGARPRGRRTPKRPLRAVAEALVIQIIPHDNGEVFLSKRAVDQNPSFFGFPFAGRTSPKVKGNPSYPQRLPDPVVDLKVHGAGNQLLVHFPHFGLNTVFYETKAEIRVTVPRDVVKNTPPYSVLLMRKADEGSVDDYQMDIYTPDNPLFPDYFAACNQTMPSGGKAAPRRMGWL